MEFPLHPNVMALIRPRINKRNPHELHWRRESPEWHGSIDKTHGHLYRHLADESCCLQCGAIPCPYDHEEHKRLKLADLDFVKELAKERRALREKVGKLEMILRNMEEKQMQWKGERIMLMDHIRQYERLQTEWERHRKTMEGEIERLKMLNTDNLKKLQSYKKDQERLRILTQRVSDLEKENSSLKDENKKFRGLITKQADDIQELENQNKELVKQSEDSQIHIHRLKIQLDETYGELRSVKETLAQREERLDELEIEVTRLTQELSQRTIEFQERDKENQKLIKDLENEIVRLKAKLHSGEAENQDLRLQIQDLLMEIDRLKSKLSSDTRFKKFVDIKRECNTLKEKNENLLGKVFEHEHVCHPVPFLKASGRVTSASRKRSPPAPRRPGSALDRVALNRPKSSRTLHALDQSDSEG